MKLSQRGDVDPFIVMDVMEAARKLEAAGRHVIHMEVGQPSTGAPQAALARLGDALQHDAMGYTVGLGLPALRARIARHYGDVYNVDLDPQRVVVTAGASGAFLLAFNALFETGARVGLGYPCYPSYRQILRALDMQPVGIRTTMENRMQPVPADLAGLRLDGLLVASPANPTGTMLDRAAYQALSDTCNASGISLISDEIYHGIEYGSVAETALSVTDDVYVINSFSKYFSMTGWRVGWMVVPKDHIRPIERLAQNMFICPNHAAQRLALASMDARPELDANLAVYKANRDLIIAGLREAGLGHFAPPDGAFYIYTDVSAYTDDALAFTAALLQEAGVAAAPGVDFDPEEGHHWVRFCYARQTSDIIEGIARIKAFMAGRRT
ncbi:pyridoxal phosphate-dependent aminotransferase [Ketogulonicigenium vulgare]|uniref:Aminotransferase n=1 Tax=Ketogulonicigenium vulgare (strain WSH-001) TaxID=759362 RepID=F9Y4A3_KETVW|nr:aminotransferase class I/II-fold pyridoxal phosphate-dependent enzyme [Ketogulonicigenium vulgare]AEM40539.1 Aminotransferase, classes I and II superfamily protein [Ketogulonicigenium vulgare WSH-001]